MITHAAHYAGWPVAASAFRVLAEVWPEVED
jgi:alkylhydroperoxidase/carboxymuconolactone decarboxylase family protein YurZ